MKSTSIFALGIALAFGGVAVAAPAHAAQEKAEKQPERKFSKEARPSLAKLQEALKAGDDAAFQAALAEAQAAAQNADDRYAIAQFQLSHASKTGDDAEKLAAVTALLQSGGATEAEIPTIYANIGALQFNAENYAAAAEAFRKVVELQPDNPDAKNNLAAALSRSNPKEAAKTLLQAIEASKAAGETPSEETYKQALSMAYENNMPEAIVISREIAAAYPTPENWRNALGIYREMKNPTGDANLDLMRLMRVTKALNSERNYYELADVANTKGLPGEAKAVLEEGIAAGAIDANKPVFKEILGSTSGKIADDKASLAGLEKKAMASSSGTLALNTGEAYYGYGDYAKAAALFRAALQKGGVDANVANMRLGMALAQAGQKAEAEAAFKAVTGANADIAAYWLIWLNQKA